MTLPRFQLVDWFSAAEGRFDLSLSHSDCDPLSVSDLLDEHQLAEFASFRLGYGPFAGLSDLRHVVADQYTTIQPEEVLIFGGPSETIYTFMQAMLRPGDEVVVQIPSINSLHAIARSLGCRLSEWRPSDEMSCSFDVSVLADLCNQRTKLIVFNFPHNPSLGERPRPGRFQAMEGARGGVPSLAQARRRGAVRIGPGHITRIVLDETFREKFIGLGDEVESCDADGRVVGRLPLPAR